MAAWAGELAVGLDVGQTATKLVVLKGGRKGPQLVHSAIFRNRDEGILSEEELGEHLRGWLADQGYGKHEVIASLPQYLAIAQISDFPSVKGRLDELVAQETQHLAGLSDEAFISGYAPLPPFGRYQNPVFIGVCRESAVNHRLSALTAGQLRVGDLVMEGQALARACRRLLPAAALGAPGEAHLLLDIGLENSTLVVTQQGYPAYVASILFGGDRFTAALAAHLGCSRPDAERHKHGARVIRGDQNSPLTQTAFELVHELQAALENWHSQSPEGEAAPCRITRICLSGGGACLEGLDEYLGLAFDCPAQRLRVSLAGEAAPELMGEQFVMAYGVALEGLLPGKDEWRLSLAPANLRWATRRRRRAPLLFAAVTLLLVVLVAQLTLLFAREQRRQAELAQERLRLMQCRDLMPELKRLQDSTTEYQQMLRPFVATGNRNLVFVNALKQLSAHTGKEDWLVLVADEQSYWSKDDGTKIAAVAPPPPGSVFGGQRSPAKAVSTVSVQEFRPWERLYASGFTPYLGGQTALRNVRQMVDALNAKDSLFAGVDLLAENALSDRNFQIRDAWLREFRMRPFTLVLPLRQTEFPAESAGGGK